MLLYNITCHGLLPVAIVLCVCKWFYKRNKLQWYQYLRESVDKLLTSYKSLIFLVVRIMYGLQCNAV
nr:MAG TPA: hypothetical protein [Caudoviricetes sp.]